MRAASRCASSGVSTTAMPPALPRPPIGTCALTAIRPSSRAAAAASSDVRARRPAGHGDAGGGESLFRLVLEQLHRLASLEKAPCVIDAGAIRSSSSRSAARRAPRPGTSVRAHLLRRGGAGDHREHLRLRRETADRDVEHGDTALSGERLECFDDIEVTVAQPARCAAPDEAARRVPGRLPVHGDVCP